MLTRLEWYDKVAAVIAENLEEFYQTYYDEQIVPVGKDYRLQPCPVCQHQDCCTIGEAVHCFSCEWKGTHINCFVDYMTNIKHKSKREAIKMLEEFTGITYPRGRNKEEYERELHNEKLQEIKSRAVEFYHQKLLTDQSKYTYEKDGISKNFTALEYQLIIRRHQIDTLKAFKVGFVKDYLTLRQQLLNDGFTADEIKEAKIWFPEGVFVYTNFHPVTKDILRMNIKNPFKVTMPSKNGEEGEIVQGMSSGDKVLGFSPGFSFNKPCILVEGENDAQTVYEHGWKNVCWTGGNLKEEQLNVLERMKAPIYVCTDNDAVGAKYVKIINEYLPHKDVRQIEFDKTYNDIDDYYKKNPNPLTIEELMDNAEKLETDAFKIFKNGDTWIIANRHKRLEFTITGKDSNGRIIGKTDFYIDDILKDREEDKPLTKCRANKRPFNFYLSDKMEQYFNTNLEDRSFEELLSIYKYCAHKSQVIKLLAKHMYNNENEYEEMVDRVKIALGGDVCDAVLKEVNDLQNADALKNITIIPKMKVSHYFNVRNDDAYFYFTLIKKDVDATRRLPYLIRNDKKLIRLDLLKRKDSQCLLLVDNKYELPFEITEAFLDLRECSLWQPWVVKYTEGEIPQEELNPYNLLKTIESYIRKFYFHPNDIVYKILALYILGTYYYELFGQYPYLFLNGEKGSGKSLLDTVLYLFAFNAKLAANISEASLFRMTSVEGGTIIMDEVENLTSRSKNTDSIMATILKSGYAKGASVYRYNPEKGCFEGFDPYSPKVISNIFGLEDVIEDRCIRIDTYRMKVGKVKLEDPKIYLEEKQDEIKEITSKCCLSALENFQQVARIYRNKNTQFITNNARLSQILTPIYTMALFADLSKGKNKLSLKEIEDLKSLDGVDGEYTSAFKYFYDTVIFKVKQDIEDNTPEGIVKHIVNTVALELADRIPSNEKEYTIPSNHKYKEPIRYSIEEGWFEINLIHLKCFVEENMPGETAYSRTIHKWVKSCFNVDRDNIKRRTATIEDSDELLREFNGNHKPKVYHYRFYFRDFVEGFEYNDFLDTNNVDSKPKKVTNKDLQDQLF